VIACGAGSRIGAAWLALRARHSFIASLMVVKLPLPSCLRTFASVGFWPAASSSSATANICSFEIAMSGLLWPVVCCSV
jgi:hypothetical protein